MAYRKKMSKSHSKGNFKRSSAPKKINHQSRAGVRGGIRL